MLGPLIGRGAFGLVNMAYVVSAGVTTPSLPASPAAASLAPGTLVAIKSMPCPDDVSWLAARREAAALRAAASPHVVRLHGLQRLEPAEGRPNPTALLVMEYLPGGTLTQCRRVPHTYYMNVVQSSYSNVWWDAQRWEAELDFMMLNGVTVALAYGGQEALFREVYLRLGVRDAALGAFFTSGQLFSWGRGSALLELASAGIPQV